MKSEKIQIITLISISINIFLVGYNYGFDLGLTKNSRFNLGTGYSTFFEYYVYIVILLTIFLLTQYFKETLSKYLISSTFLIPIIHSYYQIHRQTLLFLETKEYTRTSAFESVSIEWLGFIVFCILLIYQIISTIKFIKKQKKPVV